MKRSTINLILVFAMAALAASGCMSKEKKEAVTGVKKAVRDYCDGLIEVYWNQDARIILNFAGKREANKIDTIVANDRIILKRKMRSSIKEFKFEKIYFEKDGIVTVRTREKWTYEYISAETGAIVEPEKTADYHLEYFCTKSADGKKYIVEKVSVIEDHK